MTNCGWIFEWGDPSKDCGLPLHHESPHDVAAKYRELLKLVYWLLESDSDRHYDAALHYRIRKQLEGIVAEELPMTRRVGG